MAFHWVIGRANKIAMTFHWVIGNVNKIMMTFQRVIGMDKINDDITLVVERTNKIMQIRKCKF